MITQKTDKLPPGVNARNWPGFIKIRPGLHHFAAVWAQEAYEASWKLNPINMLRFLFSKNARIDMEIMGHEVEVQTALMFYGANAPAKRSAEAHALEGYEDFRKLKYADIYHAMVKAEKAAKNWVVDHAKDIREMLG